MSKKEYSYDNLRGTVRSKAALHNFQSRRRNRRNNGRKLILLGVILACLFAVILVFVLLFRLRKEQVKIEETSTTQVAGAMNKDIYIDFTHLGITDPFSLLGKTEKQAFYEIENAYNYDLKIKNSNPNIENYVLPEIVTKDVTLEPGEGIDSVSEGNLAPGETSGASVEEEIVKNKYEDLVYIPERESFQIPNLLSEQIQNFIADIYANNSNKGNKINNKDAKTSDINGKHCDFVFNYKDDGKIAKIAKDLALVWSTDSSKGEIQKYDKVRNEFVFGGDKKGYKVKEADLENVILNAIYAGELKQEIETPYTLEIPQGENLKDKYRVVASFTTETSDNEIRNNNVNLACQAINGKIIQPWQEFSFNRAVGKRTEQKGYGLAPAYAQGEVVEELGGGVCQVSSTLYNAIICSGHKTTYRMSHTFEPAYVAPGLDATVTWNGADYKFMNTSDYPLGIKAHYLNNKCTVEIFCIPILEDGITVSVSSTKVEEFDIPAPVLVDDSKPETSGTKGSEWQVFKITKKDGKMISKEHDHYSKYKGHTPQMHQEAYSKYLLESESESIKESERESIEKEKEKLSGTSKTVETSSEKIKETTEDNTIESLKETKTETKKENTRETKNEIVETTEDKEVKSSGFKLPFAG